MRNHLFPTLALALAAVAVAAADTSSPGKADPERIEKLIQQLSSPKFNERSRARQQLKAIGEPALEALRKAATSDDLETSRTAGELVKGLEARQLTANLLAPKRVQLNLQDTPVLEAVAELSRVSGYPITVVGDTRALAERKVTLKTGETTFWEAFDQLCQKGGLVEGNQINPGLPVPPIGPLPPIKIRPLPGQQPGGGILPVIPPANPQPPQAFGAPAAAPAVVPVQIQVNAPGAAPAQIQVQVPVAAPPAPPVAQPGVVRPGRPALIRPLPVANGQIVLQNGTPQNLPTCYAGALRIRALPPQAGQTPAGEVWVRLEVSAEPRLQGFNLQDSASVEKALDDHGQSLAVAMDAAPPAFGVNPAVQPMLGRRVFYNGFNRQVLIRLKAGEKQAAALKELSGSLTATVLAPTEALVTVDKVLQAAGKKVQGANGGSLEVLSINKEANGDYRMQVRIENPPAANVGVGQGFQGAIQIQQIQIQGGGNVIINGNAAFGNALPNLIDAKGQPFQLVNVPARSMRGINGVFTQEVTMDFRPQNGQGEPASLVLVGQRSVTVPVPFRFENVPVR